MNDHLQSKKRNNVHRRLNLVFSIAILICLAFSVIAVHDLSRVEAWELNSKIIIDLSADIMGPGGMNSCPPFYGPLPKVDLRQGPITDLSHGDRLCFRLYISEENRETSDDPSLTDINVRVHHDENAPTLETYSASVSALQFSDRLTDGLLETYSAVPSWSRYMPGSLYLRYPLISGDYKIIPMDADGSSNPILEDEGFTITDFPSDSDYFPGYGREIVFYWQMEVGKQAKPGMALQTSAKDITAPQDEADWENGWVSGNIQLEAGDKIRYRVYFHNGYYGSTAYDVNIHDRVTVAEGSEHKIDSMVSLRYSFEGQITTIDNDTINVGIPGGTKLSYLPKSTRLYTGEHQFVKTLPDVDDDTILRSSEGWAYGNLQGCWRFARMVEFDYEVVEDHD